MLNEIFDRAKSIHKERNKQIAPVYIFFLIVFSIPIILYMTIGEEEDKWLLLLAILCLGGIILSTIMMISLIVNSKKFNKKLELKLTDREKVSKINKALEKLNGKIVFTEDYIIIFNEEIFETSEVAYINPILAKGDQGVNILIEIYLKNAKIPKSLCIYTHRFFKDAKIEMIKLEPIFEKMREANISVGEATIR